MPEQTKPLRKRTLITGMKASDTMKSPLCLLLDETSDNIVSAGPQPAHASKCFCMECQKVFPVDNEISGDLIRPGRSPAYMTADAYRLNRSEGTVRELMEISCPECGNQGRYIHLPRQATPIPSWETPPILYNRTLSKYEDDEGRVTRVDDRLVTQKDIITGDGPTPKITKVADVITEISDLENCEINVSHVTKQDDGKVFQHNKQGYLTSPDPFTYLPQSMSPNLMFGARHMKNMHFGTATGIAYSSDFERFIHSANDAPFIEPAKNRDGTISDDRVTASPSGACGYGQSEFSELSLKINREKLRAIETRFQGVIDPLFADASRNGLYLSEHHPNSTEEDTPLSTNTMSIIGNMMVRYPAAFIHAAERTEAYLTDQAYAAKRKQEQDPNFVIKEPTDSAKSRVFRQSVTHVAEQLAAADDKVTKAVKGALTTDEMRSRLGFFVKGVQEDTQVPRGVRLQEDGTTMNDPVKLTKNLKKAFQQNPISTAANLYSASKLNIRNTDHLNRFLSAGAAFAETAPKRVRRNGRSVELKPKYSEMANAGVIAPIRGRSMMSFMKRYVKTHEPGDLIKNVYVTTAESTTTNTMEGYPLLQDTLRLWDQVTATCRIADTPDEIKENFHEIAKEKLKNYLEHKSIDDAYIDFIEQFGERTFDTINQLATEIQQERRVGEAYETYMTDGIEAAKEKYPAIRDLPDPEAAFAEYEAAQNRSQKPILATRNGKPLFDGNSLRDIHDELSVMAKRAVQTNQKFDYTKDQLKLEDSYDAPDAEGKWTFRLVKDSNDVVRTATQLHNCVAGYIPQITAKTSTILYMEDECANRVACIEVQKYGRSAEDGSQTWSVRQFQSDHDRALPSRFAEVAKQWMDDHGISYAGNYDVMRFGTDDALSPGGRMADYHQEEVDEAEGIQRPKDEMHRIQERRYQMALELYGANADGKPNIPTAPDGLSEFK